MYISYSLSTKIREERPPSSIKSVKGFFFPIFDFHFPEMYICYIPYLLRNSSVFQIQRVKTFEATYCYFQAAKL